VPSGITPLPWVARIAVQIGLLAQATFALAAFGRVQRDHVISRFHRDYARADFANDACALMAENGWKDSLAVEAVECIGVGVANPGCLYLDKDFTGLGAVEVEFDDFKGLLRFERDSGASFHLIHLLMSNTGVPSRSYLGALLALRYRAILSCNPGLLND
jgi:hypothetical protein